MIRKRSGGRGGEVQVSRKMGGGPRTRAEDSMGQDSMSVVDLLSSRSSRLCIFF